MRAPSGLNAALQTESLVALEACDLLARGRVPHPRRLVIGGGDDARPVRAERGAPDKPSWPLRLAICWPEAASHTRAVLSYGGGDDARPVRAERGAPDRPFVALEACDLLARGRVPHARRPVIGGGDDARPVRAECGAPDTVLVALEACDLLARGRVPHPRRLVPEAVTTRAPSGLKAALRTRPSWAIRATWRLSIAEPASLASSPRTATLLHPDDQGSAPGRGSPCSATRIALS